MTRRPPSSTASRHAFTLVEVLLALSLLTALLLALNMFLFSMGELWGQNRQRRLFDQHVRAVTRHLGELLQRGALTPSPGRELRLAPSPASTVGGPPEITFDLRAGDRLLPWPGAPLPDVACALSLVPERGLFLLWQSRWETNFETDPPRRLVVSPMVTRLDYLYYQPDSQAWQTLASPLRDERGHWVLPALLRLHFQRDRYSADTVVSFPPHLPALPAF